MEVPAMDQDRAASAISHFVHSVAAGRFTTPPTGWSAESVAAHVGLTIESFAEIAEALQIDVAASYDNRRLVGDEVLDGVVVKYGGLEGLAGYVDESGERLLRVLEVLTPEQLKAELAVHIEHDGQVVVDGISSFESLIDQQLAAHLAMHDTQLAQLRLKRLQCILLREPPGAALLDAATATRLRLDHRDYLAQMAEEGNIIVSGPLDHDDDSRLRGLMFYDVGTLERARALANEDPAVRGGLFEVVAVNFSVRTGDLVAGKWRA
jgi:uncharacterized protein YciI